MNKKVTSINFGVVNRRMLCGGMILSLLLSLFLCGVFLVCVNNARSMGDIKQFLPMTAIVLGISFALCVSVYAYLCFTALDEVMATVCGRTQFDYRPTDVFQVNEIYLYGGLHEDNDNWFCICNCDVYHLVGLAQTRLGSAAEPRYRRRCTRQRVMFCFSSGEAVDRFVENSAEHKFWRCDGEGGLRDCDRPNLANLRLVASA